MKKIIFILVLSAVTVLFCSCGNVDVTCSIDISNNVEMRIDLQIDGDGLTEQEKSDLQNSIFDLTVYWENSLGYEVLERYNSGYLFDMTISKKVNCKDTEEAVNELLKMMASDSSPFSSIKGGYTPSYLGGYYSISAEVDLSRLVDYDYLNKLPQYEKEYIYQKLSEFKAFVHFDFYGETVEYDGRLNKGINTVELSLDNITEISSVVKITDPKLVLKYNRLENDISELEAQKKQYVLFSILAGGLLLAVAALATILMVLRNKGKKKNPESQNTHQAEPDNTSGENKNQ